MKSLCRSGRMLANIYLAAFGLQAKCGVRETGIHASSAGLGVLSAGARNAAQCIAGAFAVLAEGDIAQGENADQMPVAIEDWQPPHLKVAHIPSDLFEVLILEAVFDVLSHDIA